MDVQWIIVGFVVAAAAFYIVKLIARSFKARGCTRCVSLPHTNRMLKKLAEEKKSAE